MQKTIFYGRGDGNKPLLFALLLLIVITTLGNYIIYSSYIVIPFWILCLFYGLQSRRLLTKNEKSFVVTSFALLAIVFTYKFVGYSSMEFLNLIVFLNWIVTGMVAVYAMKILSGHELSYVFKTVCGSLILLMMLFVKEGTEIVSNGDAYEAVNVAVAWYGSLFMLLSGLSLIVLLNAKGIFLRFAAIVILLLTLYINVFILQRGTNVIFTLAEMGMILIFLIKRKTVVIGLSVVVGAIVVFAFSSDNLIYIFNWLEQISPSDRLSVRFHELSMALQYESIDAGGGSFASRGELMSISWNTFTSNSANFIFGAGEHIGKNNIIGHHSFIIDTLACYGIIGGLLLFLYFKKQYQIIMSYLDKTQEWALYMQCTIVFLFYVLRNFYGQVAYALVNIVILLLFPLTFQLIHYYKNK